MTRDTTAIRIGIRPAVAVTIASGIGFVAFFWPFVLPPSKTTSSFLPPLLFGVLLVLVLVVIFADVAQNGIDAKAIAMLGVLSAVGAALRPLGAGTAGIETIFFLLVIAGRVFGPGFGFALGCTTLFASALLTGGVGPWMPYQMFGCAWVGLFAGLLPRTSRRIEVPMIAAYGAAAAYAFGFMINLSFWPFTTDPHSTIAYVSGASFASNAHRYLLFDATTSLGWDTGRAITTVICTVVLGPALLATFRRASHRAAFQPSPRFVHSRPGDGQGHDAGRDELTTGVSSSQAAPVRRNGRSRMGDGASPRSNRADKVAGSGTPSQRPDGKWSMDQ